jgi:hypothetical protein
MKYTKLCGATKVKKTRKGKTKGKECFNKVIEGDHCHHHKKKSEPEKEYKYEF